MKIKSLLLKISLLILAITPFHRSATQEIPLKIRKKAAALFCSLIQHQGAEVHDTILQLFIYYNNEPTYILNNTCFKAVALKMLQQYPTLADTIHEIDWVLIDLLTVITYEVIAQQIPTVEMLMEKCFNCLQSSKQSSLKKEESTQTLEEELCKEEFEYFLELSELKVPYPLLYKELSAYVNQHVPLITEQALALYHNPLLIKINIKKQVKKKIKLLLLHRAALTLADALEEIKNRYDESFSFQDPVFEVARLEAYTIMENRIRNKVNDSQPVREMYVAMHKELYALLEKCIVLHTPLVTEPYAAVRR